MAGRILGYALCDVYRGTHGRLTTRKAGRILGYVALTTPRAGRGFHLPFPRGRHFLREIPMGRLESFLLPLTCVLATLLR
jgi:hypothetical protein